MVVDRTLTTTFMDIFMVISTYFDRKNKKKVEKKSKKAVNVALALFENKNETRYK